MDGIEFLRNRFGVSKGKTLEETIGTHLNINTVVKELDAFKKQEVEDALSYSRTTFIITEEDYKTIDEEIYTYFVCMFGENVTPAHVFAYDKFDDYCRHHGYNKNFVLRVIKNKGK